MKENTLPSTVTSIDAFKDRKEIRYKEGLIKWKETHLYKEKIIIGYTGHRPDSHYKKLAERVYRNYLTPNVDKIDYIVTGGAKGWDMEIMKYAMKLGIPIKIRLAFKEDIKRIPSSIREYATEITWKKDKYIHPKDKIHYLNRNQDITNESDELHAYLRKRDGGTVYTVGYCKNTYQKIIFNWWNLSFVHIPAGYTEQTFAGYRKYFFSQMLDTFEKQKLRQMIHNQQRK